MLVEFLRSVLIRFPCYLVADRSNSFFRPALDLTLAVNRASPPQPTPATCPRGSRVGNPGHAG